MTKARIQYLVAGLMALAIIGLLFATTMSASVQTAHAQVLTADELFGGDITYTGDDFATDAGLGSEDLPSTIAAIIRVAMGFLGVIAVVIILAGGFMWMIAGGDNTKVDKARKMIIYGVTGLGIVLASYAIASFVIGSLTTAIAGP